MGEEPPSLLPQDIKVSLQRFSKVFPSEETERRCMFLSNIDQILNFNVETIHFFAANPDFPAEIVAEKIKDAFGRVLVPYDYLAGRLRLNVESGRLEIDCNSAGAVFALASSELSLEEIGDLVYPNPAFQQLVVAKSDKLELEDDPLCALQVTIFKCGGFAVGISTNHVTFDGLSFKVFLENLASLAANKPLVSIPNNNRHLLSARSPPRVTFAHPELKPFDFPPPLSSAKAGADQSTTIFQATLENLDFKIFQLSADDIINLKEKAKVVSKKGEDERRGKTVRISSFNVVTAHIWRCKALSAGEKENMEKKKSTILYAVDLRSRLSPPLPPSYTGNAIISAYATASCSNLEEGPFSELVRMIAEGADRITDEYARSVIDWSEFHKGLPQGEVLVSSWWKLGFADVEYPWGRPRYSCPVVYYKKDIILLFPHIEGVIGKGVNVLVALPRKEMEIFQTLFHDFLLH